MRNYGRRGEGAELAAGMVVLAIEPIVSAGGRIAARAGRLDGADGSAMAHFEYTVTITEDGLLVLTAG